MERKKTIRHYRDLEVYQKAFTAAMKVFVMTKTFPADDKVFTRRSNEEIVTLCMLNAMEKTADKFCY